MKDNKQPVSFRFDDRKLYTEFKKYAKSEGRSVTQQLIREMQKAVAEWKKSDVVSFTTTAAGVETGRKGKKKSSG